MLGSWSLGDYFKRESLGWTLEWLLSLGVEREQLNVTVFTGDEAARDRWLELGIDRIRELGREDNWWGPPGPHGPCGPDSEIFHGDVELGNNVFIVHEQTPDGTLRPLPQRNVDVGMGLERIACLLQGVDSVYDTDLFTDIRERVRKLTRTPEDAGGADRLRPRALRRVPDRATACCRPTPRTAPCCGGSCAARSARAASSASRDRSCARWARR